MPRRDLATIVTLSFLFFVAGNWVLSITSPDEGKNLDASLRMLETKNFIVPYYNCQPRFEKPPMFYWLTDLAFAVFGVNEFSGRIVSGISATGLAILTYFLSLELFNPYVALNASLVFLTFPHNWIESRAATPEMVLTFFMTLGVFLFLKERYVLGWVSLAFAFLSKGPVGVILPVAVYLLWKRNLRIINLRGIFLFFVIGSSWYLMMLWKFGYAYFYKFFLYENIMRFTGQKSIHPYPFWYYTPIVLANLIFYLPKLPSLRKYWDRRLNPLLLWSLFVFIFYSIAKNKLHHYMLFLYPPLAVILGYSLSRRYIKIVIFLGALTVLTLIFIASDIEKERFTLKAIKTIKESYNSQVVFYKTELSSVVFYTRRCIPKVNDPKEMPEGALVITKYKYAKEIRGDVLFVSEEFGKQYAIIRSH